MLRYILYFIPAFAILTNVNYYQVKNIATNPRAIFLYTVLMIPAFFIANFGINYTFNTGYKEIGNIWHLNIYLWVANFMNIAVFSYFWFGEIPTLRTAIAALLVIIAILLIV